jgi:hypothetical protein
VTARSQWPQLMPVTLKLCFMGQLLFE